MLVIFPFEEDFYNKAGIPALYVGHPLIERIREEDTPSLNQKDTQTQKTIALLPGSRRKNINDPVTAIPTNTSTPKNWTSPAMP